MSTVYIVHCIDTEGPLYESTSAKFERLSELLNVNHLDPTVENLQRLRAGDIKLGGRESEVRRLLSGHLTRYNETWDSLDGMLERISQQSFRNKVPDSRGQGWRFNWFCMDHVGYAYNPRRRDIGYHNIFDHYQEFLKRHPAQGDAVHWHFHPMSTYRDAHRCATHYFRSPEVFEILARKVIERAWFPSAYRAGFQTERPDSHWFLEQWIPFDLSNMALSDPEEFDRHLDFRLGRSGDWRRAPADWSVYRPSHDDYQQSGSCRRMIARALNVFNRIGNIDGPEMDKAFARAANGEPTLVGIAGHDWRDLAPEVEYVRELVVQAQRRYPDVPFVYSEAGEAFRGVVWPEGVTEAPLDLDLEFIPAGGGDGPSITVSTRAGRVFGPQPFLAIEIHGRRFVHDNFDFAPCGTRWHYPFNESTVALDDVVRVGVAASDIYGRVCVRRIEFKHFQSTSPIVL
ncbi:MAG: hypothetical protein HZC25_15755 [Rhodospirillales bacterium]|nr:hypothetical protein [Rhodospirillales bacterium]